MPRIDVRAPSRDRQELATVWYRRPVVAEAGRSRKLVARKVPWGVPQAVGEEARAELQDRLNRYAKLMFWSFVTLMVFLFVAYTRVLPRQPIHTDVVFTAASILLAVMAGLWRLVIARGRPAVDTLYGLDLLFAVAIGLAFGGAAAMQYDLKSAGYTSLIFVSFSVFTRASLVPSSLRRTAIVSSMTFLPMIAAAGYLAFQGQDIPPAAYFTGAITFCTLAVVIAANASGVIYGLRQKVREAMQLGVYKLDRKIGEGGIGTVYHAHHALLRRPTAIKLLQPGRNSADDLTRFEKEVRLMSQLTHPNTVTVFDYGPSPDGEFYYAMEYLPGIDLGQLVKKYGAQPARRVIHILTQVCGALQEAHDLGFIHRDIKPANIILCERGGVTDVAKVVDFGLVKEITNDTGVSTQIILGTPQYLSPEQAVEPDRVGPASDVYALGAVGYWLLTGQLVFPGKTAIELMMKHVSATPTPPSRVTSNPIPPELEAILLRCLEKAPADRFPSARALADALEAVPKPSDWSVEAARSWWKQFHATPHTPLPIDVDMVTIDIAKR